MEAPEIISSASKPKSNVSFGFSKNWLTRPLNWLTRPFKEEQEDDILIAIVEKALTIESKKFLPRHLFM